MLVLQSIHKSLGGRTILRGVSSAANRGEPLGVVGPNGSGKTTLLRVAAGALQPDSGRVVLPPGVRVAFLPQGVSAAPGLAAGQLFPAAFPGQAEQLLSALAERLANERDPAEIARLSDEFDRRLAAVATAGEGFDVERARMDLGLRSVDARTPARQLSGGELAKLALLDVFARDAGLLLLDEPTNHLDLDGLAWLEERLEAFRGAVLVVSHDRVLLDNCVAAILELDPRTGSAEVFAGGYSDYAAEKARRDEELWARYRRQQREERRLRQVISGIESRSRGLENRTINFYFRKRAAKVARRAVTLKARLERQLDSAEHVQRPAKTAGGLEAPFRARSEGASRLLSAEGVSLELGGRRLLHDASFVLDRGERVALVGPNGSGKTTLLRAILGELPVAAGTLALSGSARVGYLPQEDPAGTDAPGPDASLMPVQVLRRVAPLAEADAFNFLHRFLFGHAQLSTPVARLSYGERRRLALAGLVLGGANLLLLDEPTNHLDLPAREAFEAAFASFEGGALVVTHDRHFLERFADRVLALREGRLVESGEF
jgi:macrolide transport system ATP-binding/permease protein